MKAVLGLLFLLTGFTLGWLVISGKISSLGSSSSTATAVPGAGNVISSSSALGNITASQLNARARNQNAGIGGGPITDRAGVGGGPIGLPTVKNLNDLGASQGAYK